jgi:hypothetical protein
VPPKQHRHHGWGGPQRALHDAGRGQLPTPASPDDPADGDDREKLRGRGLGGGSPVALGVERRGGDGFFYQKKLILVLRKVILAF